jgi:hypothetical protein
MMKEGGQYGAVKPPDLGGVARGLEAPDNAPNPPIGAQSQV